MSSTMQGMLRGLQVHHKVEAGAAERLARLVDPESAAAFLREFGDGVDQPLIRRNGDDGRLALFVAGYWMDHVVGLHRDESDALLAHLMAHATHPRFHCRWRWSAGDLAIWDERRTMHIAMPDHYPRHRKLRRCTVTGEAPLAA
jgi:taurine dioxygenase